ncbi:peptide-methionine (R)-S-oxide reductase, partial [Staphylococcus saprophyticus]|uniref:peptide-methionine (R)-S-oxide reductase n=1 Tax=Staphylococcus saprophyticus TaxID=29385 RepID=UPI0011A8B4FD
NKYSNHFQKDIYLHKISPKPLFTSKQKFQSHSASPTVSNALPHQEILQLLHKTFPILPTQLPSQHPNTHLPHLFNHPPKQTPPLTYSINSPPLQFIPYQKLQQLRYRDLIPHFQK